MVGRWVFFWEGLFSGAMLVSGSVLPIDPNFHGHPSAQAVNCKELMKSFGWDTTDAFTQHDAQVWVTMLFRSGQIIATDFHDLGPPMVV